MTNTEKVNILKNMYGGNESDIVLLQYLILAGAKVIRRAYPFRSDVTEVPDRYLMNQIEIAIYLLNKRGAEGQTGHSENGISRTYESASVPESMLTDIIPAGEVL